MKPRPPLNEDIKQFFDCPKDEAEHVSAEIFSDDSKAARVEELFAKFYAKEIDVREFVYQVQTMGEAMHEKLYCHCVEDRDVCERCRVNAALAKLGEDVA